MAAKLKDVRQKLRKQMHEATEREDGEVAAAGGPTGLFQYHAVPGNEQRMKAFRNEVLRMWLWRLRRRSQRTRWTWERFLERLGDLLPRVEVQHPYPDVRFALTHPQFGVNIQGKNRVR